MKHVSKNSLPLVLLAILLASFLRAAEPEPEYRWRILPNIGGDNVNLTLTRRASSSTISHGISVPLSSLRGLERADILGGDVAFRIRRDAGTLYCKGSFTLGVGSGPMTFQPDPQFVGELKSIGLRDVSENQLFDLAIRNFRISNARDLRAACSCVETVEDVIELNDHGVDDRYLRQVTRLFSQRLSIEDVTQMKDHGVQISLLEALRFGGYSLPPASVTELQDHGVDASFVREMSPQFKTANDARDLIALHDHGVSPDFVRHLRESGANLSTNEIIQLHDHGTDAALVRSAKDAGVEEPLSSAMALQDHGIDPQYVHAMSEALHAKVTASELIQLHDHGVSADFVQQLAASGVAIRDPAQLISLHEQGVPPELPAQVAHSHHVTFSVDEIVQLHSHGIDAEFVRSFDAVGYTNASADDLIQLHDHGVTADYARRLQSDGFGVLSISQLIKMKDHGM